MFSILISLGKAGSELVTFTTVPAAYQYSDPVTFTLPGPQFRLGE